MDDEEFELEDESLNVRKLKTGTQKVINLIQQVLPGEEYVIAFFDKESNFQFFHGEMSYRDLFALKGFIEYEINLSAELN